MNLREFFDADSPGDVVWSMVLVALVFVVWPLALCVIIPAMALPVGALERGRTVEVAAKIAAVTALWCGAVLVGVWVARGFG